MSRRPNSAGRIVAGFGNTRGQIAVQSGIKLGRKARRASERNIRLMAAKKSPERTGTSSKTTGATKHA